MFENPRRGRQARNFTTNVSKILDLKSSSEQIFFRKLLLGAPDKYRFLVAKDSLDMPIVGFNVIEEITKQPVDCASAGVGESVVDALSSSLTGVKKEKVEALVNLIKTESAQELCSIKSRKQDTLIPKGQSVIVSCRAATGPVGKVPVLFELDPDSSYPSDLEIPEIAINCYKCFNM